MRTFFSVARVWQLSFFWCAAIIIGLFVTRWVRVWPSIGMAGLFLTAVGYAISHRRVAQRQHWRATLSFVLVYAVHLVSGLLFNPLTDSQLGQDLVLQLPFVLLPVSFLLLPDWLAAHKRGLWLLLIGCCLLAALGATGYFALHSQEITQLYFLSQVMPTEPDHIRLSLLVSMAILAGAVLLANRELPRAWRWPVGLAIGLLFLFQHLLAVRSGLVTLYAAGALWLGWLGWHHRRWLLALLTAGAVAALGAGCFLLFPTLQHRLNNTQYDTSQLASAASANNLSIAARVYSYKAAWTIIQEHPLLGVSKPRLPIAMAEQYSYRYPEIEAAHYTMPHNQFIYNLVCYGWLGLLVFVAGYYYPAWRGLRSGNMLLLLLYVIVTLSFAVEYTLETNLGVIIGLLFFLVAAAPEAGEAER